MKLDQIRSLDKDDLLGLLGLETRRTMVDYIVPGLVVLSVGVAVGAGIGLLLAPRPGKELREDLSKHALSIPLKNFMQFQFTAALPSQATPVYQVNLTGFRSGSVQGILVWAVRNSDLTSAGAKSPVNYIPLQAVQLSVNGLVYFTSQSGNSQLWNLVEKKTASQVSTTTLTWDSPSQTYLTAGNAAYWTWIPFAQGVETLRDESMLSNGLGIANSVVNLQVDTGLASTDCTLYASYLYNCTFLASGGSGDYVF